MLDVTIPHCQHSSDYFTVRAPSYDDDFFSIETPLALPDWSSDETTPLPTDPLLAFRTSSPASSPTTPPSSTPRLLQMQTNASHGGRRPEPSPIQNVLHTTASDSPQRTADSPSSSHGGTRGSSIEIARCSRCQRTPSIDAKSGRNNMVEYGLNLWYCTRCAQMVGLGHR